MTKTLFTFFLIIFSLNIKAQEKFSPKDLNLQIEIWASFTIPAIISLNHDGNNTILKIKEIRYEGNHNSIPNNDDIESYQLINKNDLLVDKDYLEYIKSDSVYIKTIDIVKTKKSEWIRKIKTSVKICNVISSS